MKTIHTTVDEIFASCPELCGFSVQDAGTLSWDRRAGEVEGELCLVDVATLPAYAVSEQVVGLIAGALLELIAEQPEAAEELRGRTFARTLH